jgi:ribulose-phosphate 3-epimerase
MVAWAVLYGLLRHRSQSASASSPATFSSTTTPDFLPQRPLVIGIDGGTESIRAACFDGRTGHIVGTPCAVPYPTHHPHPGWAEQDPTAWWEAGVAAVRGALTDLDAADVVALAVASTCCSVVALDADMQPLRPCLLWMDQRAVPQTLRILQRARGDPALSVNHDGRGPVSAEWLLPKALWLKEMEPALWHKATTICEYQDYFNYQLTGVLAASAVNAITRWHWRHEGPDPAAPPRPPRSLYAAVGLPDLIDKLPSRSLPLGARLGPLTPAAAAQLGLPDRGIPVVQGGPDAFVGLIGLGGIQPGQLCLITGSSHLHCVITARPTTAPSIWGAYRDVPLPGRHMAEGGQSSTGSILRWAQALFSNKDKSLTYQKLDAEAAAIPPGADGLVALETFQGARTPTTDPLARGALIGLTLSHGRGHIWRALLEAVGYGTRRCMEGLAAAGHGCDEIILAGGVSRSPLWLQMHADITGKVIVVCENREAPLLGSAILASVGVGLHASMEEAVAAMVRVSARMAPRPAVAAQYDALYHAVYLPLAAAVQPIAHALHQVRGGDVPKENGSAEHGGDAGPAPPEEDGPNHPWAAQRPIISPSLLACDWSHMEREVHRCRAAGLHRFHVDVFDGVYLDSPEALTFGPRMVAAIRRSVDAPVATAAVPPTLDVHLCVHRPERFVTALAAAGADRFIFQLEALPNVTAASLLVQRIRQAGMKDGVSINPATPVEALYPLLGLHIDCVNILAVEPGFGGQPFQSIVLAKVKALQQWRKEQNGHFDILVDGGVHPGTVLDVIRAGADVVVAGSYLFPEDADNSLPERVDALRQLLSASE